MHVKLLHIHKQYAHINKPECDAETAPNKLNSHKDALQLRGLGIISKTLSRHHGVARNFPHNNLPGTSITSHHKIKRRKMGLTSSSLQPPSPFRSCGNFGRTWPTLSIYGFVLWQVFVLMAYIYTHLIKYMTRGDVKRN